MKSYKEIKWSDWDKSFVCKAFGEKQKKRDAGQVVVTSVVERGDGDRDR